MNEILIIKTNKVNPTYELHMVIPDTKDMSILQFLTLDYLVNYLFYKSAAARAKYKALCTRTKDNPSKEDIQAFLNGAVAVLPETNKIRYVELESEIPIDSAVNKNINCSPLWVHPNGTVIPIHSIDRVGVISKQENTRRNQHRFHIETRSGNVTYVCGTLEELQKMQRELLNQMERVLN